jgi:hypothetical protein
LIVCSQINTIPWLLAFSSSVVWYFPSSHGFVCFHLLCSEFLIKSSVVVVWWSYIVLVSVYHGRFLLLHQFWMTVLLVRVSLGWSYFHSVPGIPHSMIFLTLRFPLRNLLLFWWVYFYTLFIFFSLTAFFLCSWCLLYWW